jgi:hypothetical protein
MKNLILAFLFTVLPFLLSAQYLTSISTRYSDSFIEWTFYTEDEEEEGDLAIRWLLQNDWTEWEYRIGETFGTIKTKWRDSPEEWELRGNNKIVTARTIWSGDYREWRITDNHLTLTLKTKWGNLWDEWLLRDDSHGNFNMYTEWERDPRDWVIVDELDDEVSFEMKMMMMFIVVFHSSPKQ